MVEIMFCCAPLRWFEEDLGRCVSFVVVRPMMLGIMVGMTRRTVFSDTVAALTSTPAVACAFNATTVASKTSSLLQSIHVKGHSGHLPGRVGGLVDTQTCRCWRTEHTSHSSLYLAGGAHCFMGSIASTCGGEGMDGVIPTCQDGVRPSRVTRFGFTVDQSRHHKRLTHAELG